MILGMGWMAVAGTGAVLYESAEGTSLSHSYFLILIFATYGCLPGLFTGWHDGTRRKQHETIATREDQLVVLSRILRHNLRNAMNVILGRATTIKRNGSDQLAAHAQEILDTGQYLMAMTEKERILVETLVNPAQSRALNLDPVLKGVVERLRGEYPNAKISVPTSTDCRIRAVPEIEQAVGELIENGIVHTNADHPRVAISIDCSNSFVTIQITDNGETIPAEEIALLTDTQTETQLTHGSGIGLKLANRIIIQSDGKLEFDTSEQVGTQVFVTLPRAK
ncbi:MAG: sensor histidine kinase [Halobacteriota archaeon]